MKKGSKSGSGRNKQKSNESEVRGGKKKSRDIKNARSLSDVLGKAGGKPGSSSRDDDRGPSTGGGRSGYKANDRGRNTRSDREDRFESRDGRRADTRDSGQGSSRGDSRPGDRSSSSRDESPSREPFTPGRGTSGSSKLTTIMRFQTPEERAQNAQSQNQNQNPKQDFRDPQAPHRPQSQGSGPRRDERPPAREVRPNTRVEIQMPRQSRNDEPPERRSAWPKERVAATPPPGKVDSNPKARAERGGKAGAQLVSGMIKRHPDGFGFLIPDRPDTPDIYVARQSMTGVMTNDKVEVELYRPRSGGKNKEERLSGEIVRVIQRANSRVVGKYLPVDKKYGIIQDDNRGWGADLRIAADDTLDAKEGQLVAVEITQYPDDEHEFTGKVVSIIGDVEDPVNDVIRVVHQSGIPTEFSTQAVNDAKQFGGKVTEAERKGREDLTSLNLITIDGATAKDFDDAIYAEQTAKGFKLIVAIADVSHYVKPGSRLDEEAYERGTSTYFPNYVVPMLPEELSNELCSLKPHVLRLCFCCEMYIDFDGEVKSYRFFEGVMESKARVIYGEAQEVIDAYAAGTQSTNTAAKKLEHVAENILRCADLAKILMKKRFQDGSLDLEIPETQVVVDGTGESTDIIKASRIFAHRLIEELMLVTNICTARYMDNAQIPGVYRVHEEPDADNIQNLQRFLWNMGGSQTAMKGSGGLAGKLTKALQSMEGKPEAAILNILTLRTMKQAHYSEQNVGHFGLGFTHYSHFTSPIRRYPDLIAHRIIKSQLYAKYSDMQMSEDEIQSATTWLSSTEQRSTKAERKVISIKKARFMRRFIGQEFEGMISSVAKFGVFVLLRQYDVDGLVKIENLGNDRFEFDEENLRLIGRRSGLQYTIGDQLKVRVMGADPETGKIDFELSEIISQKSAEGEEGDMDAFFDEERGSRGKKRPGKPGARKKAPAKGGAKQSAKPGAKASRPGVSPVKSGIKPKAKKGRNSKKKARR